MFRSTNNHNQRTKPKQYRKNQISQIATQLLTYLLTPHSTVLLEKLTALHPVKKFSALYETRQFITASARARHPSLSCARSIQSMLTYLTSWRSILILSSHLRLSLPRALFTSGFSTKAPYAPILSLIRATCPTYLTLSDMHSWYGVKEASSYNEDYSL